LVFPKPNTFNTPPPPPPGKIDHLHTQNGVLHKQTGLYMCMNFVMADAGNGGARGGGGPLRFSKNDGSEAVYIV